MNFLQELFLNWQTPITWVRWLQAIQVLLFGVLSSHLASRLANRLMLRRSSPQAAMVTRRLAQWLAFSLAFVLALRHLGFDLSVLLGAAGVLTVALGFAAQTSASNLISGLFLMGERPFVVGDFIEVDGVMGDVISIDWLSVKMRTRNNLLVRIPNETMVKARVTNYTRHPLRRIDIEFVVPFGTDLAQLERWLLQAVDLNPLCFDEPSPSVQLYGFAEGNVQGRLCVWTLREHFVLLRTQLHQLVSEVFLAHQIPMGVPQRQLRSTPEAAPDLQGHSTQPPAALTSSSR